MADTKFAYGHKQIKHYNETLITFRTNHTLVYSMAFAYADKPCLNHSLCIFFANTWRQVRIAETGSTTRDDALPI